MFTDEVSQKGAKDMSQKNMEVMLSMEDKAEAEELTAFLQSVNITTGNRVRALVRSERHTQVLCVDQVEAGQAAGVEDGSQ